MTRKKRKFAEGGRQRRRNISVRSIRRNPPDVRTLGRAIVAIALAEAEAEAQAQAQAEVSQSPTDTDQPREVSHD